MIKLTVNSLTKQQYRALRNIVRRFTKDAMRTDELLHVVLLRLLEKNTTFNFGMFYVVTKNELSRLKRIKDIPTDKDKLFDASVDHVYKEKFNKLSVGCNFTKSEKKVIDCIVNKQTDILDIQGNDSTLNTIVRSIIKKVRDNVGIESSLPIYIRGKNGEHKN
jgi:hypothetical protein